MIACDNGTCSIEWLHLKKYIQFQRETGSAQTVEIYFNYTLCSLLRNFKNIQSTKSVSKFLNVSLAYIIELVIVLVHVLP